ncbi:MAG: cell wall biosis glycosyltransferase-like protein [Hyphomicrobiales bacterium]|nr:cell wall biosis glycosyltransferase-like protein [Hyphomicrobiales bacterium]
MKALLSKYVHRVFAAQGKVLRARSEVELDLLFTQALAAMDDTAGGELECVIFSKDRAMQLHALLGSYLDMVKNPRPVTILYKASDTEHRQAYSELADLFADPDIRFVEETDFRQQMIEHATRSPAAKIMLLVDDMLFKDRLDFERLVEVDSSKHILVLTRGRDLTYSSVLQKPLVPPAMRTSAAGFQEFSWYSEDFSDWTFPLGVSGYMFGRKEWLAMLTTLKFKAPNSLEAAMQAFVPVYRDRPGLCPETATCVCVHANMVQTELSNPTLGTFSIEELLRLWQEKKMIDRSCFYGLGLAEAEVLSYRFVERLPVALQRSR